MNYDSFTRGEHPVGVRTLQYRDTASGRTLEYELWYPAAARHWGEDLAASTRDHFAIAPGLPEMSQAAVRDAGPASGSHPLFVYFHGGYGDPRECTHLATHVASHGYVVAAQRFGGDSFHDTLPGPDGQVAAIAHMPIDASAMRRPGQASAFLDSLLAAPLPGELAIRRECIASGGFSMGGFTALALNSIDRRPKATFAMCPMFGGRSMVPQVRRLRSLLRVDDWGRPVPALILSGAADPMVNAADMRDLVVKLAAPRRLVLLAKAGHLHWADRASETHESYRRNYLSGKFPDPEIDAIALGNAMRPFAELCSGEQAGSVARALCVAHLDACLRERAEARVFLEEGIAAALTDRGLTAEILS